MTALGLIVVGVSSQLAAKLREAIAANCLPQPLASDLTLRLGELLRLPTFRLGAEQLYERLTLLIVAGKITQVFYPVPSPGSHAAEVLDHLTSR
jgi:peroxiredoxin